MNIKEFVEKLQNLSDQQKKAIIIAVVIVLAFVMGFFWFRGAINRLNQFGKQSENIINLPEISLPDLEMVNTTSPTN